MPFATFSMPSLTFSVLLAKSTPKPPVVYQHKQHQQSEEKKTCVINTLKPRLPYVMSWYVIQKKLQKSTTNHLFEYRWNQLRLLHHYNQHDGVPKFCDRKILARDQWFYHFVATSLHSQFYDSVLIDNFEIE